MKDTQFRELWNSAEVIEEVMQATGQSANSVRNRATRMRNFGYRMKGLPPVKTKRGSAYVYLAGTQFEWGEFDDLLPKLQNPKVVTPSNDEQQLMTAEVYRRAAIIRASRPGGAVREEQVRPVEIAVVNTHDLYGQTMRG